MIKHVYIGWAYKELMRDKPSIRVMHDWFINWKNTLVAINNVHGIFEVPAIVFSKCEFLGSLYRGNTEETNWEDFKLFLDRFFKSKYKSLHRITENKNKNSEAYTVFRNRVLHSGQPAGISQGDEIIGWWMGYGGELRKKHLMIDYNGNLNIHCRLLVEDFLEAIKKYALYLKQDRSLLNNKKPTKRWREAFWATFRPLYYDRTTWMHELIFLEKNLRGKLGDVSKGDR